MTVPWTSITGTPTTLAGYGIASPLDVAEGGAGLSVYVAGDMLYASAATTLAPLSIGGSGAILTSNGSNPQWSAALGYGSLPAGSGSWDSGSGTTITVVRNLTVSGTLSGAFPDGTVTTPGIGFSAVPTGFYRVSVHTMNLSVNGAARAFFSERYAGDGFQDSGSPPSGGVIGITGPNAGDLIAMMPYTYGHVIEVRNASQNFEVDIFEGSSGTYIPAFNILTNAGGNEIQARNYTDTDCIRIVYPASPRVPFISTQNAGTGLTISPLDTLYLLPSTNVVHMHGTSFQLQLAGNYIDPSNYDQVTLGANGTSYYYLMGSAVGSEHLRDLYLWTGNSIGTNTVGTSLVLRAGSGTGASGGGQIKLQFAAAGTSGSTPNTYADAWLVQSDGSFQPATDNHFNLGSPSLRVRNVYAGNSIVVGTDPGGGQMVRVGGTLHVGGASTLNATATVTSGGFIANASANDNWDSSIAGQVTLTLTGGGASLGGGTYQLQGANGTIAAPTATVANDALGWVVVNGHTGSAYGFAAAVYATAAENWSPTARGSAVHVMTVANGTTTASDVVVFGNDKSSVFNGRQQNSGAFTAPYMFGLTGNLTSTGGAARGFYDTPTLIASANNDALTMAQITGSITPGAFTGLALVTLDVGALSTAGLTSPADPILVKLENVNGTGAANAYAIKFGQVFGATTNYLMQASNFSVLAAGDITTATTVATGDPGSGSGAWKLGKLITGAVSAPLTTKYVQVMIDGTLCKLTVGT